MNSKFFLFITPVQQKSVFRRVRSNFAPHMGGTAGAFLQSNIQHVRFATRIYTIDGQS